MEVDIGARREKSLQKVKDAWKSIIERYSNLNENEQGDIVDLLTGRIVTDTGHLRSLKEEKHNIWNQSKDQDTEGIIGKEKSPKTMDKYNRRTLPIIGSNRHFQSINTRSQPGDTKYVVSSSQHMTRSKVIGDDNIFVDVLTLGDVKPSLSYDLPGTSDEENDTCKDNSEIMCTRQRRSTLIDQSKDPLNVLDASISLDTPSKVRRLRRAIDQMYTSKSPRRRRRIHKLVLKSKKRS